MQTATDIPIVQYKVPPEKTFMGFCAACLRESLGRLETNAAALGCKSTSSIRLALLLVVDGAPQVPAPSRARATISVNDATIYPISVPKPYL